MKNNLLLTIIALLLSIGHLNANYLNEFPSLQDQTIKDSVRLAELDRFWANLSKTVREGDYEGYSATYHEDAVVVFATGENKTSVSLSKALEGWKQGFSDTKSGKIGASVEFRFSQRIGDATSAHETGIFKYKAVDSDGKENANQFVHFEMLLVKRNNQWVGVMEYQKSFATQAEWDALK